VEFEYKKRLSALAGHAGPKECLTFHPDGQALISGSDNGTIQIWHLSTGKKLIEENRHEAFLNN
jgi:WD40 repeat protein